MKMETTYLYLTVTIIGSSLVMVRGRFWIVSVVPQVSRMVNLNLPNCSGLLDPSIILMKIAFSLWTLRIMPLEELTWKRECWRQFTLLVFGKVAVFGAGS
ncbi:unnamed protein product [Musa acuminata subsp. burmannicoides]